MSSGNRQEDPRQQQSSHNYNDKPSYIITTPAEEDDDPPHDLAEGLSHHEVGTPTTSSKKSSPLLSLRVVMAAIVLLLIAIVAVVTLSITVTVSYDAVREVGKELAQSQVASMQSQAEGYFNVTSSVARSMRGWVQSEDPPLPDSDPLGVHWNRRWQAHLHQSFLAIGRRSTVVIGIFADDSSYVMGTGDYDDIHHVLFYRGSMLNASAQYRPIPGIHFPVSNLSETGETTGNRSFDVYPVHFGRDQSAHGGLWSAVESLTAFNHNSPLALALSPTGSHTRLGISLGIGFRLMAPSYGKTNMYGLITLWQTLSDLNRFARNARPTENSKAYLVNAQVVLGSSTRDPVGVRVERKSDYEDPSLCSSIATDGVSATSTTGYGCLVKVSNYPVLSELPENVVSPRKGEPLVNTHMDLASMGKSFVTATTMRTEIVALDVRIIAVIPEDDLIGQIAVGMKLAIGVTVLIFLVSAVISVLFITVVLSPLSTISERMYRAASLQDEETDGDRSAFSEIWALQDSYYSMNTQLNALKSFVPQTVLAAQFGLGDDTDSIDSRSIVGGDDPMIITVEHHKVNSSRVNSQRPSARGTGRLYANRRDDDTMSRASSVNTSHSRQGHHAAHPSVDTSVSSSLLNLSSGLRHQKVSVLAINLLRFNQAVEQHSASSLDRFTSLYGRICTAVLTIAQEHKGVVDSFHGDRFFVTFNAVSTVAMHATRATSCASKIVAALKALKQTPTIGLYSDTIVVGNVGANQMRRFGNLGVGFSRAVVMERLCRYFHHEHVAKHGTTATSLPPPSILVPHNLFPELECHFLIRAIDFVRLPPASRTTAVGMVLGDHDSEEVKHLAREFHANEQQNNLQPGKSPRTDSSDPTITTSSSQEVSDQSPSAPVQTKVLHEATSPKHVHDDGEWMYANSSHLREALELLNRCFRRVADGFASSIENDLKRLVQIRQHSPYLDESVATLAKAAALASEGQAVQLTLGSFYDAAVLDPRRVAAQRPKHNRQDDVPTPKLSTDVAKASRQDSADDGMLEDHDNSGSSALPHRPPSECLQSVDDC